MRTAPSPREMTVPASGSGPPFAPAPRPLIQRQGKPSDGLPGTERSPAPVRPQPAPAAAFRIQGMGSWAILFDLLGQCQPQSLEGVVKMNLGAVLIDTENGRYFGERELRIDPQRPDLALSARQFQDTLAGKAG